MTLLDRFESKDRTTGILTFSLALMALVHFWGNV